MQEKSLIKKNILLFIENKGISKYKFYQETGITRGVLDQNNGMSEENTTRFIAYYPEINIEWLLTGKGEMLKKDVPIYKGVPAVKSEEKQIPLVNVRVAAGFGNADFKISEQDVKAYYVIPKFKHRNIDFMIEVTGSSMYPKYNSGDVIACTIIKESSFIQWNKTHVIATQEQGLLVKRLKEGSDKNCLLAISDNESYPPFEIPKSEITGIALVVGVIRLE